MATITNTNLFTPNQVSGLALWLDSADPATVVTSGNSVTAWNDKSGNNRNFTTTSGTPTYSPPNGINFSGARLDIMSTSVTVPYTAGVTSLYVVVRVTGVTNGHAYIFIFGNNSADSVLRYNVGGTFNINDVFFNQTWFLNGSIGGTNIPVSVFNNTTLFDGTINFSGTTVLQISSSFVGRYFTGFIQEVLLFNSTLATEQRQQVESYLAWKWNLQINLPTSHPFFNNPVLPNLPIPQLITPFTQTNVIQPVTSPLQVSGCALWLDAADSTSVVLSGSNVTQWNDKSGSNFHAIATGGPTYTSNSINVTNSSAFRGNINIPASLPNPPQITTFVVAITAPVIAFQRLISVWNKTNNDFTAPFGTVLVANSFGNIATQPIAINRSFFGTVVYNVSGTVTNFFNGSLTGTTSGQTGLSNLTEYMIAQQFSSGQNWNGFINEVLIYNSALTTTERQQIEGYLAWKWNLQASLSRSHPYYFNPLVPNLVLQSQTLSMSRAVGFQPNQISGLSLWLDAADTSRMTLVDSNISQYIDKSPNAIVLSNATVANQPTLVLDTNNIPNILFNGTTQFLQNASVAASNLSLNNEVTVFFAHSPININNSLISWTNAGGIPRINFHTPEGTGFKFDYAEGGSNGRVEGVVANYTTSGRRMEGGYKRGTTQVIRGYGSDLASRINNLTLTASTSLLLSFGSFNSSGYYYGGRFCELVWFNRGLSDNDIAQIEGYLAWKWGLQTRLPSSHPFSLFPPG